MDALALLPGGPWPAAAPAAGGAPPAAAVGGRERARRLRFAARLSHPRRGDAAEAAGGGRGGRGDAAEAAGVGRGGRAAGPAAAAASPSAAPGSLVTPQHAPRGGGGAPRASSLPAPSGFPTAGTAASGGDGSPSVLGPAPPTDGDRKRGVGVAGLGTRSTLSSPSVLGPATGPRRGAIASVGGATAGGGEEEDDAASRPVAVAADAAPSPQQPARSDAADVATPRGSGAESAGAAQETEQEEAEEEAAEWRPALAAGTAPVRALAPGAGCSFIPAACIARAPSLPVARATLSACFSFAPCPPPIPTIPTGSRRPAGARSRAG